MGTTKQIKGDTSRWCGGNLLADEYRDVDYDPGKIAAIVQDWHEREVKEAYLKGLQDKTTEMVKVFERLKLEVDACVCECGEKWSETDIAVIIDQTLKQLQEGK